MNISTNSAPATSQRVIYVTIACVLILAFVFIWNIMGILFPFILSFCLAYISLPLKNQINKVCSSDISAMITTIIVVTIAAGSCAIVVPMMYKEVMRVIKYTTNAVQNDRLLENYIPEVGVYIDHLTAYVIQNAGNLLKMAVSRVLSSGFAVTHIISNIILTPFLTFFMIKYYHDMLSGIRKVIPNRLKSSADNFMSDVNNTISKCIRGQLVVCIWMSVYYWITLGYIGINSAFAIGSFAGIMTFLPYVGYFLVSLMVVLSSLSTNTEMLAYSVAILAVGGLLESYVIAPKFLSKYTNLNPIWTMFALMAGGYTMGIVGLLLAVPSAAVLRLVMINCINKYLQSRFYKAT